MRKRTVLVLSLVGLALGLAGCGPSNRSASDSWPGSPTAVPDFGESVRNGVILAIEQQNQAGGIDGRKIELRRPRRRPGIRKWPPKAAQELIALRPDRHRPGDQFHGRRRGAADEPGRPGHHQPTVASTDFYGGTTPSSASTAPAAAKPPRTTPASCSAGARRVAFDLRRDSNAAYSTTWVSEFTARFFEQLGGAISGNRLFRVGGLPSFAEVVKGRAGGRPDALLFVASSLDTARLCPAGRRQAPQVALSSTEWAASGELLTEMGAMRLRGLLIAHAYDREDSGVPSRPSKAPSRLAFSAISVPSRSSPTIPPRWSSKP